MTFMNINNDYLNIYTRGQPSFCVLLVTINCSLICWQLQGGEQRHMIEPLYFLQTSRAARPRNSNS